MARWSAEGGDVRNTVTVINCGGTINMSGAQGARPDGQVAQSLQAVQAALSRQVTVKISDPFPRPPDSSNLGYAAWDVIFDALKAELDWRHEALDHSGQPRGAGIVVAHGTDTMPVTSLLVALELSSIDLRVPVVFTGAHATPDDPRSDAVSNLTKAITLAGPGPDDRVLPPGVFVVIGQDIHLASRVTKVGTAPDAHGRYFESFPAPIGQVWGRSGRLELATHFLEALRRPESPVPIRRLGKLGHVEHLVLDAFATPVVLAHLRRRLSQQGERRCGVVLQGNFTGAAAWPALIDGVRALLSDGVVVAVGSRAVFEAFDPAPPGLCLIHRSLSHPAARLKLSWLLGTAHDVAWVGVAMGANLVGEVFETDALPDWIAYDTYPGARPGTEVVLVYPDIHRAVIDDAVARLQTHGRARRELYLYGFGHGHIPGPNASVGELTAHFVARERLGEVPGLALAPDLWAATELLAAYLQRFDRAALLAWLLERYEPLHDGLVHDWCEAAAHTRRQALRGRLREHLWAALGDFESQTGVGVRHKDSLLDGVLDEVHLRPASGTPPIREAVALDSTEDLLERVLSDCPVVVARRLVKDAVMAGSPLHAAVGEATDLGVKVHPRTQVARGKADTTRYEAGTLLLAVGAGGAVSEAESWRRRVLLPRT